ncbi:MAG: hypothetical protein J7L92_05975 [Dehalococcoidia bacterium]|nr:hypothetical protein [Dehalococcoidia bacterium]HFB06976.1 hypothetical protein [Chloroflexota bacterium]
MIKSVGIDLAGAGEHKVRCLDERAQMCDGLTFQTTPEGLSKLEERIFRDGSNPVIVFEPTGLAWLIVAIYLKARHPDCHLVRVQARKVVALRKYLHCYLDGTEEKPYTNVRPLVALLNTSFLGDIDE